MHPEAGMVTQRKYLGCFSLIFVAAISRSALGESHTFAPVVAIPRLLMGGLPEVSPVFEVLRDFNKDETIVKETEKYERLVSFMNNSLPPSEIGFTSKSHKLQITQNGSDEFTVMAIPRNKNEKVQWLLVFDKKGHPLSGQKFEEQNLTGQFKPGKALKKVIAKKSERKKPRYAFVEVEDTLLTELKRTAKDFASDESIAPGEARYKKLMGVLKDEFPLSATSPEKYGMQVTYSSKEKNHQILLYDRSRKEKEGRTVIMAEMKLSDDPEDKTIVITTAKEGGPLN